MLKALLVLNGVFTIIVVLFSASIKPRMLSSLIFLVKLTSMSYLNTNGI